ncbi:sugar ABC transporter ATP-binding protein [Nordella sp. HKS 07]|uniref:sugar ABC transporter ATP-binding protein n=1 Tax=Nordella sp. HKS 07 TaxID=2712222 RepID=UPI0013E1BCCA|nr:sugar ABC transporter ATP-binding protein [Nordella sp. HKS 07]QIG48543.1 sugar ABC transporter ATP-binding protein [Nordella sp. HKS 07]
MPALADRAPETPSESSDAALRARRIGKSFGAARVLQDVSLDLKAGEILAVVGENGAGKSTLMKILAGIHDEYDGEIELFDRAVRFTGVRDAERRGVAIIHQELNLVPGLSVAENIYLGREPMRFGVLVDRKRLSAAASRLLAELGIRIDPSAQLGRLRIGEQQLVEIAKAISIGARILIMDEPTSALSPAETETLFAIVRRLAAEGVAVIYISHRMDEIMALADQVMILRDGRHVLTAPIGDLTRDRIITAMVGREVISARQLHRSELEAPVLAVKDLSLDIMTRRGARRVIDGVSFAVRPGEILGIGGLLGSGRTEILETIFGASVGRGGGEITIGGKPVAISSPQRARALGLAFVPEDRKLKGLVLSDTISDNVALPSFAELSRFGMRRIAREESAAARQIRNLAIVCRNPRQNSATLSGGNQQKVVLGKWLETRPRVLLLDEPTRGIDVGAKQEIHDLILALARDGLAVVVVSSELPELLHLSDRILVMSEGRPQGLLSRAQASEEAVMRLAARGHRDATIAVEELPS